MVVVASCRLRSCASSHIEGGGIVRADSFTRISDSRSKTRGQQIEVRPVLRFRIARPGRPLTNGAAAAAPPAIVDPPAAAAAQQPGAGPAAAAEPSTAGLLKRPAHALQEPPGASAKRPCSGAGTGDDDVDKKKGGELAEWAGHWEATVQGNVKSHARAFDESKLKRGKKLGK